ncbi:MAG: hypothetical protein ACK5YR_03375 [Pirellula sp.]|jgi:hypothetical protein
MMANYNYNINGLRNGLFQSVLRHLATSDRDQRARHATIDLDSFPIQVHGKQQGSN